MLELHCHTTYSDGTLTPTELVNAAVSAGVRALAITDHDTLSGWHEAFAAAKPHDLEIIPGLELSTVHNNCSLHILGFYPDPDKLHGPLHERLASRKRRACQIVAKLAELGYPIELPELSGNMAPGRPHIAAALVRAGYFQSQAEVFDRLLGDFGPAYVPYEQFSSLEGIQMLHTCDAVPVWAHPYLFRGGDVEQVLGELVAAGLMGVEVYHPNHSPSQIQKLEALCIRHGLLKTGGSDYHGPNVGSNKPDYHALNMLHLPLDLLEPVKNAARNLKSFELKTGLG